MRAAEALKHQAGCNMGSSWGCRSALEAFSCQNLCLHFVVARVASYWSEGRRTTKDTQSGRDVGRRGAWLGRQQNSFQVVLSNVCIAVLGLTFLIFCMKLRSKVHENSKLSWPVKLMLIGNVYFILSFLGICLSSFPDFHFSTFFHVLRSSVFPSLKFSWKF